MTDWCWNAVECWILNGETPSQGWAPALTPLPWIRARTPPPPSIILSTDDIGIKKLCSYAGVAFVARRATVGQFFLHLVGRHLFTCGQLIEELLELLEMYLPVV